MSSVHFRGRWVAADGRPLPLFSGRSFDSSSLSNETTRASAIQRSFVIPYGVKALTSSQTKHGISMKDIIGLFDLVINTQAGILPLPPHDSEHRQQPDRVHPAKALGPAPPNRKGHAGAARRGPDPVRCGVARRRETHPFAPQRSEEQESSCADSPVITNSESFPSGCQHQADSDSTGPAGVDFLGVRVRAGSLPDQGLAFQQVRPAGRGLQQDTTRVDDPGVGCWDCGHEAHREVQGAEHVVVLMDEPFALLPAWPPLWSTVCLPA